MPVNITLTITGKEGGQLDGPQGLYADDILDELQEASSAYPGFSFRLVSASSAKLLFEGVRRQGTVTIAQPVRAPVARPARGSYAANAKKTSS